MNYTHKRIIKFKGHDLKALLKVNSDNNTKKLIIKKNELLNKVFLFYFVNSFLIV